MASRSQVARCAVLLLLCCPLRAVADKLQITSTPPGATVELDGVAAGVTPFEKDFPGGYFRKTRTSMVLAWSIRSSRASASADTPARKSSSPKAP